MLNRYLAQDVYSGVDLPTFLKVRWMVMQLCSSSENLQDSVFEVIGEIKQEVNLIINFCRASHTYFYWG
jgi:molybdopterin biosynthesis enzyme